MDREEFIERLQRALAGGLGSGLVAENVRYYREYIDSEIRKGRSEEEVLASLGDPRLLAKSIIEANKHAGASEGSNRGYDEEMAAETVEFDADDRDEQSAGHVVMLPGWLIMLIVTVVVVVLIGLATALISVFAPVIIGVLAVILIVKLFQRH